METRASYMIVGTFVLVIFFGILGFFLWLASDDIEFRVKYYDIYFQGSVTGLTEGAKVNYSGVPVGLVKSVELSPKYLDRVRVHVGIRHDIPIHENAVASLEMQGITGYTFVQINGGSKDVPLLTAKEGEDYPVIPSKYSSVEEILTSLPKIANQMANMLDRVNMLIDQENREAFSDTLQSVRSLSAKLDKMADPMAELVEASAKTMKTVDQRIERVGDELQEMLSNLNSSTKSLGDFLQESQGSLKVFGQSGLYELTQTIAEARRAIASISSVADQLNENPSQFLFEKEGVGVRVPAR